MFAFRRLPINTVVRSLRASTINPIISSNTSSIYSSVSTTSSSSFIVSRNMNFITDMISRVTTKTIDSTKGNFFLFFFIKIYEIYIYFVFLLIFFIYI